MEAAIKVYKEDDGTKECVMSCTSRYSKEDTKIKTEVGRNKEISPTRKME